MLGAKPADAALDLAVPPQGGSSPQSVCGPRFSTWKKLVKHRHRAIGRVQYPASGLGQPFKVLVVLYETKMKQPQTRRTAHTKMLFVDNTYCIIFYKTCLLNAHHLLQAIFRPSLPRGGQVRACGQGGAWVQALTLLRRMRASGAQPSVRACNAALGGLPPTASGRRFFFSLYPLNRLGGVFLY